MERRGVEAVAVGEDEIGELAFGEFERPAMLTFRFLPERPFKSLEDAVLSKVLEGGNILETLIENDKSCVRAGTVTDSLMLLAVTSDLFAWITFHFPMFKSGDKIIGSAVLGKFSYRKGAESLLRYS